MSTAKSLHTERRNGEKNRVHKSGANQPYSNNLYEGKESVMARTKKGVNHTPV